MGSQAKFKNFLIQSLKFIKYLNDFRDYKMYDYFDNMSFEKNIFIVNYFKPNGVADQVVLKLSELKKSFEEWENANRLDNEKTEK